MPLECRRAACLAMGWLACLAGFNAAAAQPAPAEGLLFHASFDGRGYDALEPRKLLSRKKPTPVMGRRGEFPNADFASGNALPLNVMGVRFRSEGRFGGAVTVAAQGVLAFDTFDNLHAGRGTLAFWASPAAPLWSTYYRDGHHAMVISIRDLQNSLRIAPFLTMGVHARRKNLYLLNVDSLRQGLAHEWSDQLERGNRLDWAPGREWMPDEWHHLAVVWDAAFGRRWYCDGRLVAASWGKSPEYRPPCLDQISLAANAGPGHVYALPLGFSFDELYVFDYALDPAQIQRLMAENIPPPVRNPDDADTLAARDRWVAACFGMDSDAAPAADGGALVVRHVPAVRVTECRMDLRQPLDGKLNTVWPLEYKSPAAVGARVLQVELGDPAGFNFVHLLGAFRGQLMAGDDEIAVWSGNRFVQRRLLAHPVLARKIELAHDGGRINELALFHVSRPVEQPLTIPGRELHLSAADAADERPPPIRAYYPPEDRGVLRAGAPPAVSNLPVQAYRAYHLLADPQSADARIGKLLLDLRIQGFDGPAMLSVQAHDPATRTRELFRFEAQLPAACAEPRPVRLLFDGPAILLEQGRPLWLTLRFDRAGALVLGPDGSRITLGEADAAQCRHQIQSMERILCDQFLQLSEPAPWNVASGEDPARQYKGFGELLDLAQHIRRFDPENETAGAILSYVLQDRYKRWGSRAAADRYQDPFAAMPLPVMDEPGPDWAVYGRAALKILRRHVDWWINERQDEFGELGSDINDDTDMMPEVVNFSLIHDPGDRLKNGLRKLTDRAWEIQLANGINKRLTDHLHAFEDGVNLLGPAALLFYGDPQPVERLMIASRAYDGVLTAVNPQGDRLFRSFFFNAAGDIRKDLAYDAGWCLMMMPGRYLVWYNGNPGVLRILAEWQESFLKRIPPEPRADLWGQPGKMSLDFATGALRAGDGPMGMDAHLYWLFMMTGDRKYVEPVLRNWRAGMPAAGVPADNWFEWRKVTPDAGVDAAFQRQDWNTYSEWRRGAPARTNLVASLQQIILHMQKYLPVHTWVGQSADRVAIPQNTMARMYLGGMADKAKRLNYHYHAVSWEQADDDVARFVVEDTPERLVVLLYSFHAAPQPVTMRVWKLRHGRYRVRAGLDLTGDEQIDAPVMDVAMVLRRHAPIRFSVPPRQVLVVTAGLEEAYPEIRRRADLAIGPRDVRMVDGRLQATVHNIGGADAPPSMLELVQGERVVETQAVPALPAPDDLAPRTARVQFAADLNAVTGLAVRIRPPAGLPEITDENNHAQVTGRPGAAAD